MKEPFNDTLYWSRLEKLPDAATFPYPRLCVSKVKSVPVGASLDESVDIEYDVYEKEYIRVG